MRNKRRSKNRNRRGRGATKKKNPKERDKQFFREGKWIEKRETTGFFDRKKSEEKGPKKYKQKKKKQGKENRRESKEQLERNITERGTFWGETKERKGSH